MAREPHIESYYSATANADPAYPVLDVPVTADVCVVGGGYTGLSTALNLAERGFDVVLLEAKRIGWGASGLNGGQICTGFSADMGDIRRRVGKDDAGKLFAMSEESKTILKDRIARHNIDCDLRWGYFHGAAKQRQLDDLASMAESWSGDYGYEDTTLVRDGDGVAAYVNSDAYIGGLYDPGAGHLHPLNYCLGLARAAKEAGVRIFEGSMVTRVDNGAGLGVQTGPSVQTKQGDVTAKFLVLCGNAYLGDLVPALRRKIMPVGTYIGATEILGEARATALIKNDVAVADCNFVLNYYRLSRDHRLLFGGRVSYSTLMPPNLPRALRKKMLEVFPSLDDIRFDYTWGGLVAITMERTPHLGRLGTNTYFAQGFSGHGVALTGLSGKLIADAIAGQAERFDVFCRLPHTTFPGGRLLRTPTLALAMLWYRMRDIL